MPRARRCRTDRSSAAHSTRSSRETGKTRPFGRPEMVCPDRPTRWSSVAMRWGDPIWQTRSTCPMSMPSSSEAVATSALSASGLSRISRVEPRLLRQAAVMGGDLVLAEPLAQMPRHPLGHPPRVDEHERRAVALDQRGQALVVFLPHLVRHDRVERGAGHLEARGRSRGCALRRRWCSRLAAASRAAAAIEAVTDSVSDQKTCDLGDRLLRRGEANPNERRPAMCCSRSSESARCAPRLVPMTAWISSTITVRAVRSISRLRLGRQQQIQRFGRRDQDVRRRLEHRRPLGLRRVAGAHRGGDPGAPVRALRPACRIPRRGSARFLWMSALNALSGDT